MLTGILNNSGVLQVYVHLVLMQKLVDAYIYNNDNDIHHHHLQPPPVETPTPLETSAELVAVVEVKVGKRY